MTTKKTGINWDFVKIVAKRFVKGLLAVVAGFAVQFLILAIPDLLSWVKTSVDNPLAVIFFSSALLALEKYMQGYRPQ